jgi:hypothetical protein
MMPAVGFAFQETAKIVLHALQIYHPNPNWRPE